MTTSRESLRDVPRRGSLRHLRIVPPGLRSRLRQFDLERRVALALAVVAVLAGFATYLQISSAPPFGGGIRWVVLLLNLDLILLLLLGVLIARRLVHLVLQRRRGRHGSRLHGRLVALFGLVAIAPSIIVSIFSITFLSSGLEAWFSERIHTALTNSLRVARAYLEEHKANIRADALAMAADLSREMPFYFDSPSRLEKLVEAQAALRALSEAVLFDAGGNVLARSGLSFTFELDRLPMEVLDKADLGEVVVLTSDTDDRVRAVLRLEGLGKIYLVVGRFVDPEVLGFVERTQEVVSEYEAMQRERSDVQIASALIFGIIALLLLLAAVWTGLNFADRLATPLSRLIAAAERVRSGDLMARVPETDADDEIAVLSRAFNRMTSQLSSQQRALIEANQQLDRRRRFTEAVLTGVSAGVLGLDSDRTILLPNRQALDFLAVTDGDLKGRRIEEVMPEALPLFARLDGQETSVTAELVLERGGQQRTLLVRLAAQREAGETIGYVMTFDDITELLSAQRQA
ncbi:MAG TPA: HAMP domain-containing protein, partial [Rhodospirillales bacterium]|nr:HAMP domain-containing protein [Rhodospirillales bacterium]